MRKSRRWRQPDMGIDWDRPMPGPTDEWDALARYYDDISLRGRFRRWRRRIARTVRSKGPKP